jgi:hypothetical protein
MLVAGSVTAVPANSYLNVLALGLGDSRATLTFQPCGGGATRMLDVSDSSPSLFFTGEATCVTPDAAMNLVLDRVGGEGPVDDTGYRYVALAGRPTLLDADAPNQPLPPGVHPVELAGLVPADAAGVAVEIWAVTESVPNTVALAPCGATSPVPQVVTGTIGSGDINVAHVPAAPGTPLCVHLGPNAPAFVNVTLFGYFTDTLATGGDVPPSYQTLARLAPGLVPREPARVLDTRQGLGAAAAKVAAGSTLTLDLSAVVSPDTSAVSLNVTATDPDADGYVTAFPCAEGMPDSSNLNYRAGANVPNLVIVEPDSAGMVCLFTSAPTHLLADLAGTYEWDGGMGYRNEGPRRLLDTRSGLGSAAGAVAPDSVTRIQVRSGTGEVPAAVTVNLTAVNAGGYGYVTAYPCDQARPDVSNLNYVAGQTVATLSTVKLSATGELCLYSFGATHLLADLAGSYTASATDRLAVTTPFRWFDSREEGITEGDTVWEFGVSDSLASVTAVVANLTATGAQQAGYFTGFDCAPTVPEVSNLNYAPGTDVANLAFVPLGPGQQGGKAFCLYNWGTTHELIDVFGFMTPEPARPTLIVGIDI